MAWFTDRHFFLLAVVAYGLSATYSLFLWRRGFRADDRLNYVLLLGGFALHFTAMILRGFSLQHCPVNNLYEATVFVGWALAAACLVVGFFPRLRFICAFAAPVLFALGVFALMPSLDPPHGVQPEFSHGGGSLHAALILLAYGAFGLGSVAAVMYLSKEHDLKFHKLRALTARLPAIQRLENVTGRMVIIGFVLLTAGLLSGGFVLREQGKSPVGDIKVIWSALVWAAYLALLVARWKFSRGGKRFAWGAVVIFIFVLLTFWGTNLLSGIHQP